MEYILVGAGDFGQRAMLFFGIKNVYCFADNYKKGTYYCEKPVISIEELTELKDKYDVVLSVNEENINELSKQLISKGIAFEKYIEMYPARIAKWRNKYKDDKVFLIGNGSSLKAEDLEAVSQKGYRTLSCNFINRIFDKTQWRPDIYCCEEKSVIILNSDFIVNYPMDVKLIGSLDTYEEMALFSEAPDNVVFYRRGPAIKQFSDDLAKIVYGGHTVMFIMLQFAVYLGFSEIYLLGVDNTQPPSPHTTNFVQSNSHFYEDNEEEVAKRREIFQKLRYSNNWEEYANYVNSHYQVAREYCETHGIKIRNATRGGKLEIFERVDLDELLAK